jgi:hypothetical protein
VRFRKVAGSSGRKGKSGSSLDVIDFGSQWPRWFSFKPFGLPDSANWRRYPKRKINPDFFLNFDRMSRFVYFDYRGEFPQGVSFTGAPVLYRYLVEVSKKDCDGGGRDPAELRRVARSLLHMSLGEEKTVVVASSPEQKEVQQGHFDQITKAQIYSTLDGSVYRVVRGLDVWE